MYKVIGGDQQEYGPVTADELRAWIGEGRLSGQSLVRGEGEAEWKALAVFPEFADALRAQASRPAPAGAVSAMANPADRSSQVLARQPELRIGDCLSQSWELLRANLGLLCGSTSVVWLIGIICQFAPFGGMLYAVISGVLYGGLYLIFLNRIRGQPASVGDVFAGFRLAAGQLILAGLLSAILSYMGLLCCLLLPGIYLFIAWTFSVPLVADKGLEFWSAMELSRKVVTRVWFQVFGLVVVAFLPFILVYLIAEIKISTGAFGAVQELMSSGQPDFGRMMRLMTQIAKSSLPFVFLIKLALLLNLPFALGALMYAYESLFGAQTTPGA